MAQWCQMSKLGATLQAKSLVLSATPSHRTSQAPGCFFWKESRQKHHHRKPTADWTLVVLGFTWHAPPFRWLWILWVVGTCCHYVPSQICFMLESCVWSSDCWVENKYVRSVSPTFCQRIPPLLLVILILHLFVGPQPQSKTGKSHSLILMALPTPQLINRGTSNMAIPKWLHLRPNVPIELAWRRRIHGIGASQKSIAMTQTPLFGPRLVSPCARILGTTLMPWWNAETCDSWSPVIGIRHLAKKRIGNKPSISHHKLGWWWPVPGHRQCHPWLWDLQMFVEVARIHKL